MTNRRTFLARTAALAGALPALGPLGVAAAAPSVSAVPPAPPFDPMDWRSVRAQFPLTPAHIHMSSFLLASHPRPVADAIARHRAGFDADPVSYWEAHFLTAEPEVEAAAAAYFGVDPAHVALTDSTTMGLGLVYGGMRLREGDEILTTPHDHYATMESLDLRAARTGATVRRVTLYDDPASTSVDAVVGRMLAGLTPRTRVLAATWVHSSTGVKLPIAAMAEALREVNARRDAADRVLFCVDGVHGLGVEDETFASLGCDVFVAGAHKWLFGPRGTGVVVARPEAWARIDRILPSFGPRMGVWIGALPADSPYLTPGNLFSPGGFHSFEHRWALGEAFRFHQQIGKARIAARIHALNTQAKEALASMRHVRTLTPRSESLSSGIIAFEVAGRSTADVVAHLHRSGIVGTASPYPVSHPRIAPSLMNDASEVERTVAALAALA